MDKVYLFKRDGKRGLKEARAHSPPLFLFSSPPPSFLLSSFSPHGIKIPSNFIIQALQGNNITIYGEGSQTRSFQYVDDLVAGLMKLMNR